MSVSFDWQFEEEEPEAPHRPDAGAGPPNWRRRWLQGVLLFILLAVAGLAARAWINNRLDAVEKVEAELRGIVELELKSITDGDVELFRARQDPTDARWRARQVARYISNPSGGSTEGVQVFAPAPGLIPAGRPSEIKKAQVFGPVGRVELTQWFQDTTRPRGEPTNPLPFHVTWFYRLDEDGIWYHTAPPDGYWGAHHSWHGTWLDIHATAVEAEVLDPIARDLILLVFDGCRLLDCPQGERYVLSFESALDPQRQGNRWALPPLYLTGMPETEEGRAVWQHALERWLLDSLAQAQVEGDDVAERVIYRQLVARLQAELDLPIESTPVGLEVEPLSLDVGLLMALLEGRQHSLQSLWEAEYDPDHPEEMQLLEAEITALLQWIGIQVGSERLFELLPALDDYRRIDVALVGTYRLPLVDYEAEWLAYLSTLTHIVARPVPTPPPQGGVQPLEPPPLRPPPAIPAGDQIAFICDNRIWVGNADGSNRFLFTAGGGGFEGLHWSPDGRWLLTIWRPAFSYERGALYLLAADGSGGRLLTDDPTLAVWPIGWSPDGREVAYWRDTTGFGRDVEIWAINVETSEARQLPGVPLWSPDGEHLVYGTDPFEGLESSLWLADVAPAGSTDANWENARQIADMWLGGDWSPDSSRLALVLYDEDADERTIFIYDLATGGFTPLVTSDDLVAAVSSSEGDFLTDSTDPAALEGKASQNLWVSGWSADGGRLLALAHWQGSGPSPQPLAALALVPLDGSPPRVLAYGQEGGVSPAVWSPINPDQFASAWPTRPRQGEMPNAFLFDLNVGPIYTATQSWHATWSPDGTWVAFAGSGQVTVVDQGGQARFTPGSGVSCSTVVWNPVADLSTLGRTPTLTLTSPVDDWRFTNVRIYQDQGARALHVWGEVVNRTGDDQRIVVIAPILHVGDSFIEVQGVIFSSGYRELIRSVSLADGRGLPFGLVFHLPSEVHLKDDSEIIMHVVAQPAEPTRDDLDIPVTEFDLSGWPGAFRVSGTWENPGLDLAEYVVVVVTVYDGDGQVLGWGWHFETASTYLASGVHEFEVEIRVSAIVADLELDVGSYKVQLFGR